MESTDRIPDLIKRLYAIVSELEALFPNRRFTPDGHLVGSLGEVLAEYRYDLELFRASEERHDARTRSGKLVQIKATQGKSIGLRSCPDHLIVLYISREGRENEVFNGPGDLAWRNSGKMQRNGQRPISTTKLRKLAAQVPEEAKLPIVSR